MDQTGSNTEQEAAAVAVASAATAQMLSAAAANGLSLNQLAQVSFTN